MATYRITGPKGEQFDVEGPDNASKEDLEGIARQVTGVGGGYPVDLSGVKQPASSRQQDRNIESSLVSDVGSGIAEVGKGIAQGVGNVVDKAADWAVSGLNEIGSLTGTGQLGNDFQNVGQSVGLSGQNNLAGSIAPAGAGFDGVRGVGKVLGEGVGLATLAPLGGGALVQGGLGGALLSDKRDAMGVLMDAGMGALGGRIGEAVFGGAANVARPQLEGRVRTLLDEGVELTTGQMAGQGRPVKRLEDIAATVPLVSTPVTAAQRNSTVSLNRAATQRALSPIGERLPRDVEPGHDAVAYAADRLRAAYNDVLPRLSGYNDQTFATRVRAIDQRANIPPEYQAQMDQARNELSNAFQRSGPDGAYNGRTLRDTSERLEDLASGWRRSDDPYLRRIGDIAEAYRQQLHALARRQNPADARRLRDVDRGYASLVRVENAARGVDDGVFSARQYDSAVRGSDRSARRRQSARGQALDQDLSSAAAGVMPNTAGQGGSKDINSLIALGALGSGVLGMQPAALAGGTGIIAGRQLYRPEVQEALRGFLGRQPGTARSGVGRLLQAGAVASPYAAPALIEQSR